MPRSDIRFWYQGQILSLTDQPPQRTLLQWLRETRGACGSKEGCGEGDCGACTVVVGALDTQAPGGLRLQAINSCIALLPTIDGKALFTIEDLSQGDALHPVQQALVDLHGSQCGFCTPGFAMSLWADYEERERCPTRQEAEQVLSGNLCRCTGYRPILDAAQRCRDYPPQRINRAPVRAALEIIAAQEPLDFDHAGQRFFAPRTLEELAELRQNWPQARILAGGTDIGLWVTKQLRDLGDIIYIGALPELQRTEMDEHWLSLGAGMSLSAAFSTLCTDDANWQELADRFASLPVRNAGTLGGNVANGSPIGDSMPALIALGSRIVLQKGRRVRELALEDFYLGYQSTALEAGEFVRALRVPRADAKRIFRSWKVSKRQDQDISAVCAGFVLKLGDAGLISEVRLAFGGMAATPRRAAAAEAALLGQPLVLRSIEAAMDALALDFQPIDDMRASASYRMQVARNLLRRLWLEQSQPHLLRIEALTA